tara:strand:- start:29 stop:262 length:234 start_codon:yes stop_codon:yes gene_type:complete
MSEYPEWILDSNQFTETIPKIEIILNLIFNKQDITDNILKYIIDNEIIKSPRETVKTLIMPSVKEKRQMLKRKLANC